MANLKWNPGKLIELSGYFWRIFTLHAAVKLDVFTCSFMNLSSIIPWTAPFFRPFFPSICCREPIPEKLTQNSSSWTCEHLSEAVLHLIVIKSDANPAQAGQRGHWALDGILKPLLIRSSPEYNLNIKSYGITYSNQIICQPSKIYAGFC